MHACSIHDLHVYPACFATYSYTVCLSYSDSGPNSLVMCTSCNLSLDQQVKVELHYSHSPCITSAGLIEVVCTDGLASSDVWA